MSKKYILIVIAVLVAILAGAGLYALQKEEPSTNSNAASSPVQSKQLESETVAEGTKITKTGTYACVTPPATNGVQTLSCALSLQEDDGTNYPLNAADPTALAGIPTGQRIQVTGILQDSGVIAVESIQKL